MSKFSLAIHGGSGTILKSKMTPEKESAYTAALEAALKAGRSVLAENGTAIDAVCASVEVLENSPLFNAGRGSVYNAVGEQEMDASIMDGINQEAGAVSMVRQIKNPIYLARTVMEKSGHVFLAAEGAMEFAKSQNFELMPTDYFYDEFRYKQWESIKGSDKTQLDHSYIKDEKFGTVGAVAKDIHGNLAAATSTGGMTNKKFGRVGDSPMIGAGTYANNNTCAVSCTGSGEYFIRGVVAYDVSCLMEYANMSLEEACNKVIQERLIKIGGDGGLIAVDAAGNISLAFNTEGMYRGHATENESQVSIFK